MVKVLNCKIFVSMFESQSRYNVHFQTNTLKKGMKLLTPSSFRKNSTTTGLLEE